MLLQFDLKHIHKVNFYPSDNNFTQALLVMLVTNMISDDDSTVFLVPYYLFIDKQEYCACPRMGS